MKYLSNIRFYVLLFSICFSIGIYFWVISTIPEGTLQIIRLTQLYALTAVAYLYFTLLAGPFCYTFRRLPFTNAYLKSRRALGVSAFYFGFLHANFAFFGQLGGFQGLAFLSGKYLLAIGLSFISLVILGLMAVTAFDAVIKKLTYPKWKKIHRFVYLVGIFTLIHALMLGTHFQNLSENIPQIFFVFLVFLLFLEARRVDYFLENTFSRLPKFGISVLVLCVAVASLLFYSLVPSSSIPFSLGIHAQHILLAQQAQQDATNPTNTTIPGLKGDRTKRFTVSFLHDDTIAPNQDTTLQFQIFDASSGNRVNFFSTLYEKPMHLVIVDSTLTFFTHIHPTLTADGFTITTQFPKEGEYHLYSSFQPLGAIEQQFAFTIKVGNTNPTFSTAKVETNLTKIFGDYEVTMDFPKPLTAQALSLGQQKITFTLRDAKNKKPVTNLKPYLAAFGHLVMISESTFDYLHVHPTNLTAPAVNATGGPTVEFLPLGLYGPIKPGIYRVFAQFNPNGKLLVADFTVKIE